MTAEEFSAGDWIDRLAQALPDLAEEQKPYLCEYRKHDPRAHFELRGGATIRRSSRWTTCATSMLGRFIAMTLAKKSIMRL